MKKVVKKTTVKKVLSIEDLVPLIMNVSNNLDTLAQMTSNNFERLEHKVEMEVNRLDKKVSSIESSVQGARADILDLHDKFIHRREFDQLSLRVSKLEEKSRK